MIKPTRTGIKLALSSALLALIASTMVPWIVRFSMKMVAFQCLLLGALLFLSSLFYSEQVQRNCVRLSATILRAGSVIVGMIAFKVGWEFIGDKDLLSGISEWLTILTILHLSLAFWDRKAWKYKSSRWTKRKWSFLVHIILGTAILLLHLFLVFQ